MAVTSKQLQSAPPFKAFDFGSYAPQAHSRNERVVERCSSLVVNVMTIWHMASATHKTIWYPTALPRSCTKHFDFSFIRARLVPR